MEAKLLRSRRLAARALAKMDGVHASDAFLQHFADPIYKRYKHWAFPYGRLRKLNYLFEVQPNTEDPTVPEMDIALQSILERDLDFHQLEARGIVQSDKCSAILQNLLSPCFKHTHAFDKLIVDLRKSSQRYPPIAPAHKAAFEQQRKSRQEEFAKSVASLDVTRGADGKRSRTASTEETLPLRIALGEAFCKAWAVDSLDSFASWQASTHNGHDPNRQLLEIAYVLKRGLKTAVDPTKDLKALARSPYFVAHDFPQSCHPRDVLRFAARDDARAALEAVLEDVGKKQNPPWPAWAQATSQDRIRRRDAIQSSNDLRILIYNRYAAHLRGNGYTVALDRNRFRQNLMNYLFNALTEAEEDLRFSRTQLFHFELIRQFWTIYGDHPDAIPVLSFVLGRAPRYVVDLIKKYPGVLNAPTNGIQPSTSGGN
ncbi:hypothetical protein QFC20_007504 [Naganishia adeliensis]|uniref:Uncharacterized protein n=1 Tax=Naganishia adeliensis TaxID=92952 RepID=A0ACC2UYM1_9TREE|nr:hypothetical protein QFC20_007504 [Naganishia adeliensis]